MFVRYITTLNMFTVAKGLGYKVLLCAIGKGLKSLGSLLSRNQRVQCHGATEVN